jgi:hypothetical protein
MTSPYLRDDFAATVELYSTSIKQMKAENPQLNVSEVSFARGKAGKNSFGKRNSTEFQSFQTLQWMTGSLRSMNIMLSRLIRKNMLRLKRLKRCHVGKGHTGNGNGNRKKSGKGATIKYLTRSIAALSTKN